MSVTVEEKNHPRVVGEQEVPMRVCLFNREEYVTKVWLVLTQQTGSNTNSLTLQVTCENDPIFLWSLDITEADFHRMKSEQHILIDYQMFPSKYFELLDVCRHHSLTDVNSSEF